MLLKKRFMFFVVLALLICVGQAAAGPNANAVVSLDLIADGGAGNQRDDGVTSGTVSGQGTKIAVEVFAKGVTTSLVGARIEFDFDASVLKFDKAENSPFPFFIPEATAANFGSDPAITLPESGFLARAEFSTVADVTDKDFYLGIKMVALVEIPKQTDEVFSSSRIWFNRDKQITAADADFDGSGVVDIADFLQFVNAYGTANAKYDLDNDGVVGISDFLAFVDVYGQTVQTVLVDSVEADRAALIALYNATDGAGWDNNTNWLSDKPLGEWHGVTTNAQGRVVSLSIDYNLLVGTIPPEIGNLSQLETLVLDGNGLLGPIPPEIGNLTNLKALFLHGNQLAGAIPSEIGNLSQLGALLLASNRLSGAIPSEIGNLSNLQLLALGTNRLSGAIPPEIGNLSNLLVLDLNDNQLSGSIPSTLGNLTNLEHLVLFTNQLSGAIPSELGNLSSLQVLELSNNPNLCMPSALKDWKFYNTNGVSKCSE